MCRFLCFIFVALTVVGFSCPCVGVFRHLRMRQQGTLVVSDCLNHMSIVSGCRAAGAHIRVFKHNDAQDLAVVSSFWSYPGATRLGPGPGPTKMLRPVFSIRKRRCRFCDPPLHPLGGGRGASEFIRMIRHS